MWPPKGARFTSLLSRTAAVGLMLLQLVSPDPTCEENETCVGQDEQPLSGWYIWCFMLITLISITCCMVLACLRCWLKRSRPCLPGRTVAVFAVNDIESISGREAVTSPTGSADLHSPHLVLYPQSCIVPLGPPPPYEDAQKTSRL
ncbi:transmembrane protein 207 [Trichosurus vulpecula]|uniref:transmembrane protein 207 n=1 Tax=Trichosurus vulpecula TaxID=9337 RepID=UPI00186AF696|nr:transmembrane protein 207 [Trichosurus vulpecula]